MKIFLLFVVSASFFLTSAAQHPDKPDLVKDNLRGAVKSVEMRETQFDYSEGKRKAYPITPRDLVLYNAAGYQIESSRADDENNPIYKTEYFYDANGRRVRQIVKRPEQDPPETSEEMFFYDARGFLVEYQWHRNMELSMHLKYTNDAKGNRLECVSVLEEPETLFYSKKYDEKGNLTEFVNYENEKIYRRATYRYDEAGRKIEELLIYPNSGGRETTLFFYDANGRLIREEIFDRFDQLRERRKHIYTAKNRRTDTETFRKGFLDYASYTIYDARGETLEWASYKYGCEKIVNTESPRHFVPSVSIGTGDPGIGGCADAPFKNLVQRYTFQFAFDARGNWTRKTEFAQMNTKQRPVPVYVWERKINYYPAAAKTRKLKSRRK